MPSPPRPHQLLRTWTASLILLTVVAGCTTTPEPPSHRATSTPSQTPPTYAPVFEEFCQEAALHDVYKTFGFTVYETRPGNFVYTELESTPARPHHWIAGCRHEAFPAEEDTWQRAHPRGEVYVYLYTNDADARDRYLDDVESRIGSDEADTREGIEETTEETISGWWDDGVRFEEVGKLATSVSVYIGYHLRHRNLYLSAWQVSEASPTESDQMIEHLDGLITDLATQARETIPRN